MYQCGECIPVEIHELWWLSHCTKPVRHWSSIHKFFSRRRWRKIERYGLPIKIFLCGNCQSAVPKKCILDGPLKQLVFIIWGQASLAMTLTSNLFAPYFRYWSNKCYWRRVPWESWSICLPGSFIKWIGFSLGFGVHLKIKFEREDVFYRFDSLVQKWQLN